MILKHINIFNFTIKKKIGLMLVCFKFFINFRMYFQISHEREVIKA